MISSSSLCTARNSRDNAKFSRTVDQLKPESHWGVIGSPGIIGCLQEMEKWWSWLLSQDKAFIPRLLIMPCGGAGGGHDPIFDVSIEKDHKRLLVLIFFFFA